MKSTHQKPRVVLDTNVLVSALVFGGTPRLVTDLIANKSIRPVMSEDIMTELRRVISLRFSNFSYLLPRYEKLLRKYALWVQLGSITIRLSRDPDDDIFIETAVIGNCGFIISGDKDLLELRQYQGIRIVTPADFLKTLVAY